MTRKTIPDSEWTISVSLHPKQGAPLAQRAIGVVDSQRHNIGRLVQGLVDETFDLLPAKGKRAVREKKVKDHA